MARGEPQRETLLSDYYLRDPFDARTYPAARRKRTGPPPSDGSGNADFAAGPPQPPQSRILAFQVSCNVGARTTGSSQKLIGPALIKNLHLASSVGSLGNFSLELGVALNPVTEQDVSPALVKGWRPITERVSQNAAAENAARVGFPSVGGQSGVPQPLGPLDYLVFDPEFFLTISVVSVGAAGSALMGHVVLLERLTLAQLANMLG